MLIENGKLVEGTIDEDAVGAFGGEVVDTLAKVHSKTRARVFINEVAALAMRAIMHFGFSIGIDDESIPDDATAEVDNAIGDAYDQVEELIQAYDNNELESLPGRTVDETLEMKIMQQLGQARDSAGEIAEASFSDDNPAVVMARSGARGSMLNLTQMAGCVGQQAVRGERINRGYEDRTLSHYQKNDLSAEAHGFVENSYRGGLTPREFFSMQWVVGKDSLTQQFEPRSLATCSDGSLMHSQSLKHSTTELCEIPQIILFNSSLVRTAPLR